MVFKRAAQTTIITPDHNIDNLPDGVPAILQTLKELILQTAFNEVPDGQPLQPKCNLSSMVNGSRYGVETHGYTEIEVLLTFKGCELTLIVPNHLNNLELLNKFAATVRTGWDHLLPSEKGSGYPHKLLQPEKHFGIVGDVDVLVIPKRPEVIP